MKETGDSTHYLSSKSWRPKVKETGKSLVPASKFLEAQTEGNRKLISLAVPTLNFCRPRVKETGNSIH